MTIINKTLTANIMLNSEILKALFPLEKKRLIPIIATFVQYFTQGPSQGNKERKRNNGVKIEKEKSKIMVIC